jgi:hypothetical protein
MKNFDRQAYNNQYYQKNRDKIRQQRLQQKSRSNVELRAVDDSVQMPLFEIQTPKLKRSNKAQGFKLQNVGIAFLILLVIANTYFLLNESVEFYRANNINVESSILAAVLVELLLVAFSAIQTPSVGWKIAVKGALALLFAYSSWTLCSRVIGNGLGTIAQLHQVDDQIQRVKNRLNERQKLIDQNLKLEQVFMARRITLENDKLSSELRELEIARMAKLAVPVPVSFANTWAMVLLRLLLQLSNVVMIHFLAHEQKKLNKTSG